MFYEKIVLYRKEKQINHILQYLMIVFIGNPLDIYYKENPDVVHIHFKEFIKSLVQLLFMKQFLKF